MKFDGGSGFDSSNAIRQFISTKKLDSLSGRIANGAGESGVVIQNAQLGVREDSKTVDSEVMFLKVVEAVQNLPPVAEDLEVTLLEDSSVVLQLVFSDPNPASSLVYSIVDRPTNGNVRLEDGQFVYTPARNYFGPDSLTFKINDGEFDSNIATVLITVISVNDPPYANAGANVYGTVGDTVLLDGTWSGDEGSLEYRWTVGDELLGVGSALAVDWLEAGETLVQLQVTDEFGETDEDSVLVTLSPQSVPGFTISEVTGNTASVGEEARFRVSLTTKPDSTVTIPLESADPLEGVTLVDTLSFTEVNWDIPQLVTVIGTNANVVNGDQEYDIVLGPAQSNDSEYAGLDPADVRISGLSLTIQNNDVQFFVSNIVQRHEPAYYGNGRGSIRHEVKLAPAGLSVDERSGVVEWEPPISAEGQTHIVEIESTMSDLVFTNTVSIKVLSSAELESQQTTDSLHVTDDSSPLKGIIFGYRGEVPTELGLRELSLAGMQTPWRTDYLTTGFYSVADVPLDIYVPVEILDDPYELIRITYYSWQNDPGVWLPSTFAEDTVEIHDKWYIRLEVNSTSRIGVLAVHPGTDPRNAQRARLQGRKDHSIRQP